jgi:GNAT superfamily N-acetyltransferase
MIVTENLNIRKASAGDAGTLARLSYQTFVETFADKNSEENMKEYLSKNCTEEVITDELKDPKSTFFIAEWGGEPVGFAKLRRNEMPDATKNTRALEIQRLYVTKQMIGKKVGKVLMETCMESAQHYNCNVIWLGVWEHNHPAIAFYKHFGFETFGSHVFVVGQDAQTDLLMKKNI